MITIQQKRKQILAIIISSSFLLFTFILWGGGGISFISPLVIAVQEFLKGPDNNYPPISFLVLEFVYLTHLILLFQHGKIMAGG
jgi:hypothetical protein